jgi:MerR family transcriptional regulator, light-induced transcriptional regulator
VADDALTAGAAARRLGVAVTTLRTWHQRYGLGPSRHVAGQHRRYTAADLERLQIMRRLPAQGMAPAEAAAWARQTLDSSPPTPSPPDLSPPAPADPGAPARDGGGHTIPVGRAGSAARGVARAAMRLDGPALRDILGHAIAQRGVIGAWEEVILPVLIGIGERTAATNRYVEVEHLISRAITEILSTVPRPPSSTLPRVLLAAADEEQHTLPLEALSAALAEAGVPSRLLGARVPPRALTDAITRTGPRAVVIWSQLPATGDPAQLTRILAGAHRPLLVAAAGPGWPRDAMPPGATLLGSLPEAVAAVTVATGPR